MDNAFIKTEISQWREVFEPQASNTDALDRVFKGENLVVYHHTFVDYKLLVGMVGRSTRGIVTMMAYLHPEVSLSELEEYLKDITTEKVETIFNQMSLTREEQTTLSNSVDQHTFMYRYAPEKATGFVLVKDSLKLSSHLEEGWKKDAVFKGRTVSAFDCQRILIIHPDERDIEILYPRCPLVAVSFVSKALNRLAIHEGQSFQYVDRTNKVWGYLLDEIDKEYEGLDDAEYPYAEAST